MIIIIYRYYYSSFFIFIHIIKEKEKMMDGGIEPPSEKSLAFFLRQKIRFLKNLILSLRPMRPKHG